MGIPNEKPNISVNPNQVVIGEEVNIVVTAGDVGGEIVSYKIQLEDSEGDNLEIFDDQLTVWVPQEVGVYEVTATVTDNKGAIATATESIIVQSNENSDSTVIVPYDSIIATRVIDYLDPNSVCQRNFLPNNGEILNGDGVFQNGYAEILDEEGLKLVPRDDNFIDYQVVSWFGIPYADNDVCTVMGDFDVNLSVDLSNSSKVYIEAYGVPGTTLEFYLGGIGRWGPYTTSTFTINDNGDRIDVSHTFTSTEKEGFVLDFSSNGNSSVWKSWEDKSNIQSIVFRTSDETALFVIEKVVLGYESHVEDSIEVFGCTNKGALNYDSAATVNDGKCLFLDDETNDVVIGDVIGCKDSVASNFNNKATIDNGTCAYEDGYTGDRIGCMDPQALNYQAGATVSSDQCVFRQDTVFTLISVFDYSIDTLSITTSLCDLDWSRMIDSSKIITSNLTSNGIALTWGIYQQGQEFVVVTDYTEVQLAADEYYLMLSIGCDNASLRQKKSGSDVRVVRALWRKNEVVTNFPNNEKVSFSVYPNPSTNGLFNIEGSIESYEVFDITGSLLSSGLTNSKLDLSRYPQGTYVLRVQLKTGDILVKKIVK